MRGRVRRFALTVAMAAAGLSPLALAEQPPAVVPVPGHEQVVPRAKFLRAVTGWRAARRQVRSLRRTLDHSTSVQEALTIAAVAYGVSRSDMESVAMCESTLRATAVNGRYRGLFQQGPMFEGTPYGRAGLSVWSPYAAAMSTAYTVSHQGWRQWQCRPGGRLAW